MKKIYFAGSIRGGRSHNELYKEIIKYLQSFGEVLTEHVGHEGITPMGETRMTDPEIYNRDMDWLSSSDVIVADVSVPSLGVGFEIAKAIDLGKKVLCLYRVPSEGKLSAMIAGCPDLQVEEYHSVEEVKQIINKFLNCTYGLTGK
jgi:2'-deoxynucleoside 5'-phosphate N-hydrolase